MGIAQGLCSYGGELLAFWKGETGDDRLFFAGLPEYYGSGVPWTDQQPFGGASSTGPAAATFGSDLYLAWKGEHSDERLFFMRVSDSVWDPQQQIPNVGSSVGPALAEYENLLYAAWKGVGADQAIYYASYDGESWSDQAVIPGVASSIGPSLCTFNGRLYAAWRGMNNDQALWYAGFDGRSWSSQAMIPGVASSVGPSLGFYDNRLYAAWKGVTGDEAIWYSTFDGLVWSPQQVIPDVGTSTGPALAPHQDRLFAMWKGAGSDQALYYSSYDGQAWDPQQVIPGNTGQDTPQNIGIRMQFQETNEWCWLAVAASVSQFYGSSDWTNQCELMTSIGQNINKWPTTTVCCPTSDILQAHPDLAGQLADPYDKAAEYCLQDVGIPAVCIKSGGITDALAVNGNYASYRDTMTLDEIAGELSAGRPIAVDITWNDGSGSHVVAIGGILNDQLLICDPANGESVIGVENFPAQYYGGATLDGYALTKAS